MKKLTHEEFSKRVFEKHGNEIEFIGEYVNKRTKIKVKHKCGYIWDAPSDSLQYGHGCPKCGKNKKKTLEEFKAEVFDLVGNEYEVIGEYRGTNIKIKMKHIPSSTEFSISPKNFIRGQRCPVISYEKRAVGNVRDIQQVNNEIRDARNGEYELVGGYAGTSKVAVFKHKKCNKHFKTKPTLIIKNKTGCPHCYKSKGEDIIEEYLSNNDYDFIKQYRIKECRNQRALPFDFAIMDNGNLKLLIEYDGIQHTVAKFGKEQLEKTQRNDKIKNDFCKDNNIDLIRIPYKRFNNHDKFKQYVLDELVNKLSLY